MTIEELLIEYDAKLCEYDKKHDELDAANDAATYAYHQLKMACDDEGIELTIEMIDSVAMLTAGESSIEIERIGPLH